MRIMIVGSNGQLGWELSRCASMRGLEVLSADLPEFDITDRALVEEELNRNGADLVINAAAYTAVDRAESEVDMAFAVNRDGPAFLASACATREIPIIHISTDYVFDGTKKGSYLETDPVSPIGVYGKSKAAGEKEIRNILSRHIIIRTAWLYGVHGHNFVKTMLRLALEQETIRIVADQCGSPTNAADLAEAILLIADRINERNDVRWGTYHYCNSGVTTWYGFAKAAFGLAGKYTSLVLKNVQPITTKEFPTAAKRPSNSALDCAAIIKFFPVQLKPWKESLEDVVKQLVSESEFLFDRRLKMSMRTSDAEKRKPV